MKQLFTKNLVLHKNVITAPSGACSAISDMSISMSIDTGSKFKTLGGGTAKFILSDMTNLLPSVLWMILSLALIAFRVSLSLMRPCMGVDSSPEESSDVASAANLTTPGCNYLSAGCFLDGLKCGVEVLVEEDGMGLGG